MFCPYHQESNVPCLATESVDPTIALRVCTSHHSLHGCKALWFGVTDWTRISGNNKSSPVLSLSSSSSCLAVSVRGWKVLSSSRGGWWLKVATYDFPTVNIIIEEVEDAERQVKVSRLVTFQLQSIMSLVMCRSTTTTATVHQPAVQARPELGFDSLSERDDQVCLSMNSHNTISPARSS